jgi:hypothetical protein
MGHSSAVRLRLINVWINYQRDGYLDTSPRERRIGHSSAVRLIYLMLIQYVPKKALV